MAGTIEKSESKSSDLRENVEKALKENSRSKTLFLPEKGFVLSFIEGDDYFKALKDGVFEFKGGLAFDNDSKFAIVRKGVLRKVENGYVLEGDFSWDYVFEEVEDATKEDIQREAALWKDILEKKKVGGKEKPTVVRYEFRIGREVLYDLEREIIATGSYVRKEEGAYKVCAFEDIPGVIKV